MKDPGDSSSDGEPDRPWIGTAESCPPIGERLANDVRQAETLFQRLMNGAAHDDGPWAECAAALERCGLTPEQRDVFLRRFLKAAGGKSRPEAGPPIR